MQSELWGAPAASQACAQTLQWPIAPPPGQWASAWTEWQAQPAGQALLGRLALRLQQGATIYPPDPLRALRLTPLDAVQVVILGQDPYHGPGQAQGLAFSVAPQVKTPPSLRNVFQELRRDLQTPVPLHGCLERWAQQGVLLLNTCLTVEDGQAASHAQWGWELFTDALIRRCVEHATPKTFVLWGAHAQTKRALVQPPHRVLTANHPSPLSATRGPQPFVGCGHFGDINRWLRAQGRAPIIW